MKEAEIQKTILEGFGALRIPAWRLNSGAIPIGEGRNRRYFRATFPGCPDVVALLPNGRTLWVEVKTPKGRLSKAQEEFRALCGRQSIPHLVARSWDDVEAAIEEVAP